MADIPADANPRTVTVRNRRAFIRGVPVGAKPPTLADQGLDLDPDGTLRDADGTPLIRLVGLPGVPDGRAVLTSPVQPDEVLPGESVAEAMVRLRRAVALHTTPGEQDEVVGRD